jgi:hypothetical protein
VLQTEANSMAENLYMRPAESPYSKFKKILTSDDWFEVYQIAANLFVFYEPYHYEEKIVNLLVGEQKAALIDNS